MVLAQDAIKLNFEEADAQSHTIESLSDLSIFEDLVIQNQIPLLVQFDGSNNSLNALKALGIEAHSRIGKDVLYGILPADISIQALRKAGVENLKPMPIDFKASREIIENDIPSWAVKGDLIEVVVKFEKHLASSKQVSFLNSWNLEITDDSRSKYNLFEVLTTKENVKNIYSHPAVNFVEAVEAPAVPDNYDNAQVHRLAPLQTPSTGLNLTGDGVIVGVGDGGEVIGHIDFGNRIDNRTSGTLSGFGQHMYHVTGTIASAGHGDDRHGGMAPKANIITQKTTSILSQSDNYYNYDEMVLTNNSYGAGGFSCLNSGYYTTASAFIDNQMLANPALLHVFAAGNDGAVTCSGFPMGYNTIGRAYASSKNGLTVGAIDHDFTKAPFSSAGPAYDGRIKPELVANGRWVTSTGATNNYYTTEGTSMAAPTVTGTLALLYELYRDLNSGQNPNSDLMKAAVMNSAEDIGNDGPDFQFGFGSLNGKKAAAVIKNNTYFESSINNAQTTTHQIVVPVGTQNLKVMLYWHDKDGDNGTGVTLINNLDLKLKIGATEHLPWVLDATPANVGNPATRGIDNVNNVEQVTVTNPASGTYNIEISGSSVLSSGQSYVIVYEMTAPTVDMVYPIGGESFVPGTTEYIRWDATPGTQTFHLEYSSDNGSTWTTVDNAIPATDCLYPWPVAGFTTEAVFRISRNGTGLTSQSEDPITIIDRPTGLSFTATSPTSTKVKWTNIPDATGYEVYFIKDTLELMGVTATNELNIMGLFFGDVHWVTVKALSAGGAESKRSFAKTFSQENPGLPVELASFNATKVDQGVELSWVTESELNNEFFQIEVSTTDIHGFKQLDIVQGQGTTTTTTNYDYLDNKTILNGSVYYRLKQVDFDGTFAYSEIVEVNMDNALSQLTVYPNPVENVVNISINAKAGDSFVAHVVTMDGKVINKVSKAMNGGHERVNIPIESSLPTGTYVLRTELNDHYKTVKIFKR